MGRPFYDSDDVRTGNGPRPQLRGGWGLLAPQVFGIDAGAVVGARPAFRERAACTEIDPELFFPEPGHRDQGHAARRICASCPAMQECRESARLDDYGIWGGLSEQDRNRLHARTGRCW